ncbi:MAG: hypothetical protein JXA10_08505 [Anaerolineae bacterium]|nr:hypothetical protein [Anaerolineae bacterium]
MSEPTPQQQAATTRRVDTPDFVLRAARTILGWSLSTHRTTYNQRFGVQVELHLYSQGGRTIPRAAFRSTPAWDVEDYRCIIHHTQATIWLTLHHRFG